MVTIKVRIMVIMGGGRELSLNWSTWKGLLGCVAEFYFLIWVVVIRGLTYNNLLSHTFV